MESHDAEQLADAAGRSGTRLQLPPIWVWAGLGALGATVAVLRGTEVVGDRAWANILTWLLAFLGLLTLLAWFVFLSTYRRRLRLAGLLCCVAGAGVLAALFRVDRVSGELSPSFAFRWSREPDRLLELPAPDGRAAQSSAAVDLHTATEFDFPQFLGPARDASAPRVRLGRDWTLRPPETVWRHPIGAGWSAFSVVNGHAVTMEQRGPQELVTCYNVQTGQLEWAYGTETRYERLEAGAGPRSTPTIDDGMVYALGAVGNLMCLDGATGQCQWQKNLLDQYGISPEDESAKLPWGRSNSPLVTGDLVVVPIGGPRIGRLVSLAAFEKKRGTLVWEGGDQRLSYSSPALATLAGVEQILCVNEATASGHDPKTGKVLWEHPWPGRSNRDPNVSQAVPVPPHRVFLSKGYGKGAALVELAPRADGTFAVHVVWSNSKAMRSKFTNVALYGRHVFGLSEGTLECIELDSGRRAWKEGRYGHGQILRAGDLLLVLSESGELALVEATPDRPNSVLGRLQALEGMTWNNVALSGPCLLVRNAQEAACYRLPIIHSPH